MLTADTPFFWKGSDQVAPTYDVAKATSLLDAAGWKPGAGGIREKAGQQLVLPLWIINDSTTVLQAQILEQQLAKVGIKVDTKQYEQTAWFAAARTGEQVGFIIGIFFENPDGLLYFTSTPSNNPRRIDSHTRYRRSINGWRTRVPTRDQAVVQTDYESVQKKLIDDAPAAPLIHALGTLGKTDAVQGVKVHPSRWLYRATDIWLKK